MLTTTDSSLPVIPDSPVQPLPPRLGRWLLAVALFGTYFFVQLIIAIPLIVWLAMTHPDFTKLDFNRDPLVIWASLIAAGVAGAATAMLAWGWPAIWRLFNGSNRWSHADWVAWKSPLRVPVWLAALLTVPVVLVISYGVQLAAGPSEVDVQQAMFTTPILQVVASVVVSTVVPVAEELIFRGALYSALLGGSLATAPRWQRHIFPVLITTIAFVRVHGLAEFDTLPPFLAIGGLAVFLGALYSALLGVSLAIAPRWQRHIVPVLITTIVFVLVHGLAGFETLPPFLAIGGLALYLGIMRAVTGSVKGSVIGHVVWNLVGAIGLTLSHYLPS